MTRLPLFLSLLLVLAAAPALQAQTLEVFGLNHAPLGNAVLTEGPGPSLIVSNIGSSGLDGVAVGAEAADFLCIRLAEPAAPTPVFVFDAFGTSDPLVSIATGRLRRASTGYRFSALFPGTRGGASTVSIYDDGDLVGEGTVDDGTSITFGDWPGWVDPHKQRPLPFPGPDFPVPTDPPPQDGPWPVAFSIAFNQNTTFSISSGAFAGGRSISGDLLVIEPVGGQTYDDLASVSLRASGVQAFVVEGEMVGAFGLPHVATGTADFDLEPGRLTLSDLSIGGVLVGGLPGRASFEFEFLPFSFGAASEGYLRAFRNPPGPGDPGEVAAELLLRPEGQSARGDSSEVLGIWVNHRSTQTSDARVEVLDQKGRPKKVLVIPVDAEELTRLFDVAPLTLDGFGNGGSAPVTVKSLGKAIASPFPAPFSSPVSRFTGSFGSAVTFSFADGTVVNGFGFNIAPVGGDPLPNLSAVSLEISNGLAARGIAQGGLDEVVVVNEALAFPIVGVSAKPVTPPVVIGPGGGSFQWRFQAANASSASVPVTFRSEVVLPSGNVLPILGPVTRTLPGGSVVSRLFSQSVPAAAPSGKYVYRVQGRLPDSTLVTDAFVLRKAPALAGSKMPEDEGAWSIVEVVEPHAPPGAATRSDGALGLTVYPNPASERATLSFGLSTHADMRLAVYDVLGREVVVLAEESMGAGQHEVAFDATNLPSGVYLVRLDTGGTVQTQRLTLMR